MIYERNFVNGERQGPFKKYHEFTKELKEEGLYNNGEIVWLKKYREGRLDSDMVHEDGITKYRHYGVGGVLLYREETKKDPSDEDHYIKWRYDDKDQLVSEKTYRSYTQDGPFKNYGDGVLASSGFYRDDVLVYEIDRIIFHEWTVKHEDDERGKVQKVFIYDDNGRLMEYYHILDDVLGAEYVVERETYYMNGKVKDYSKKFYRGGNQVFRQLDQLYNVDGELLLEETYQEGLLIKKKKYN